MEDSLFQKIKRDSSEMDSKSLIMCSLFVFVVAFFMCIINIVTKTTSVAWVTGAISLWFMLNIICFYFLKRRVQLLLGMMSAAYAMMMYFVVSGGVGGFSIVWLVIIPPAAMYCFKLYYGGIFTVLIGISLFVYMHTPLFEMGYPYSDAYKLRFPILYFFVTILCMVIQYRVFVSNEKQKELIQKLEHASNAKSEFLANMSHEIRTPMNAIVGMCELILRDDINDNVRENCFNIQNSGRSLLSIINDILDFSKIESGKAELIEDSFNIGSTINDVINMAVTRKGNKDIELIVRVDPNIPTGLIGDEMRIRQVMINLVTNAVKFTESGCVILKVSYSKQEYGINLNVSVTDTGIGISDENMEKLFTTFQRVDTKKNRSVEGTGLGLPISKKFINKMGGFINVSSVYGEGSEFRFVVPLKVSNEAPFIYVNNSEADGVLVYLDVKKYKHPRIAREYTDMFRELGNRFNLECTFCGSKEELQNAVAEKKFSYCFTAKEEYESNLLMFSEFAQQYQLVVVQDRFNAIELPANVKSIYKPFYGMSFAAVLNNERYSFNHSEKRSKVSRFVAPDVRVLIVDDNNINLKVASGLMKSYEMKIDTVMSGKEAIGAIEQNQYDLVFMDHMMPEMDGVETTAAIRGMAGDYYKKLPIIALTANAINGVKEMFIENGFSDFLAKPIETSVLERILYTWIPKDMIINSSDIIIRKVGLGEENKMVMKHIDVDAGMVYSGGELDFYLDILKIYVTGVREQRLLLDAYFVNEDWKNYVISVHALKSTSKSIGANELAQMALDCELAGKNGEYDFVKENHEALMHRYEEVVEEGKAFLLEKGRSVDTEKQVVDMTYEQFESSMSKLKAACEDFNIDEASLLANELNDGTLEGVALNTYFAEVKTLIDDFDYDEAIEEIDKIWEELRR